MIESKRQQEHGAPVSVVIPYHLADETIDRALKSVYLQSARPREVIIVDDASGPLSLSVLKDIVSKYPSGWATIRTLYSNVGAGEARNQGWAVASQPIVAFLDADDSWHPQKVEIQVPHLLDGSGVTLCSHQVEIVARSPSVPLILALPGVREYSAGQILARNRFATSSVMVRRDVPIRFNPVRRYSEDYELWLRLSLTGGKCLVVEVVLAYYYKDFFGASGLSKNLLKAQLSQSDVYSSVRNDGLMSWPTWVLCQGFSWCRYARRLCIVGNRMFVSMVRRFAGAIFRMQKLLSCRNV